jgi:hypothetical protein
VVIIPFAEEDYSKKPKINYGWEAEGMDFGLPKVLVDNSSRRRFMKRLKQYLI